MGVVLKRLLLILCSCSLMFILIKNGDFPSVEKLKKIQSVTSRNSESNFLDYLLKEVNKDLVQDTSNYENILHQSIQVSKSDANNLNEKQMASENVENTKSAQKNVIFDTDRKQFIKKPKLRKNKKWIAKEKKISPLKQLPPDEHWPITLQLSNGSFFDHLNYSRYTLGEQFFLKNRIDLYKTRAKRVAEACSGNKISRKPMNIDTMVWDQKHQPNLVWCEISKVASTSWMVNFLRLGHYRENDPVVLSLPPEQRDAVQFEKKQDYNMHFEVFRLFPAPNTTIERERVFKNALRFLIVRHPFTRILSAYRDKMTKLNPRPKRLEFRKLQLDIIKKYRLPTSNNTSPHPTFSEFIQHILDTTSSKFNIAQWRRHACWKPYWATCSVCTQDFQLIMKLETLEEDNKFLTILADLKEIEEITEWRGKTEDSTKLSGDPLAIRYFSELTKSQVRELYNIFQNDFKLFDYDYKKFLKVAR